MRASVVLAVLASTVSAFPTSPTNGNLLPTKLIYESSNGTFYENIAARSNGELLLNTVTEGALYRLDPKDQNPLPYLVTTFPGKNGMTGIAEVIPDVFIVNSAVWNTANLTSAKDSTTVWQIDLRGHSVQKKRVADIAESVLFNGLTVVPGSPNLVLSADSRGKVWSVNVQTGQYRMVIEDETMRPTVDFPLGINGLHVYNGFLYYTNSPKRLYCRVPINHRGEATGNVEVLATVNSDEEAAVDDFALDQSGNGWVTLNGDQEIVRIAPSDQQSVVVSRNSSVVLRGPTSAAFGRGNRKQDRILYVATGGDGGNGQVVAVQTK